MSYAYDPSSVEKKWQAKWAEAKLHKADLKKAKYPYYALAMFPYPSGDKLHVGHWYNFAPADSSARYHRMKGKDVFEPMGFDAFGLPAENYAIKTGVPPQESIKKNVETMVAQLSRIGAMYDWDRMVNTSAPEYYRWTQWLFLKMYEHKLSYKKAALVNWCPKDQTVLANEQVQDGTCERCGTEVVQKNLEQWFWKITDYNQKLLDGLETLDWPEKTKLMQQNWIGKSQGAEIIFDVVDSQEKIKVFTTRCDTLFGATYVVLAPEHALVDVIAHPDHKAEIAAYREQVRKKTELQRTSDKTKTGIPIGAHVVNPATGKKIPVWIADYALVNYGTGAVMAVPAHDERDFDFAKAYKLPMVPVIVPADEHDFAQAAWTDGGTMSNSGFLDGHDSEEAKKKMIAWLEDKECGRGVTTFRLRDWLVSRQRYWGAPIPIVYDPQGKAHPVPEKHLPWMLPTDVEFKPNGESPLKASAEFKARTEKIFGKGWTPEYDTMDTFVCSSFYFLRYLMEGDETEFVDSALEKKWLPTAMYIGGPEHACMHLIYARFVMMALKDFGVVSHSEPFQKLVHQGLITNQGAKMSKSKGNVVSPDAFVDRHGSDVFRMYLMFMGPFTDGGDWSDSGIKGVDRFVQRVWKYFAGESVQAKHKDESDVLAALHKAIKAVTDGMENLRFNTAISGLMELLNAIEAKTISVDTAKTVALLLAPMAPHLADELWEHLGGTGFAVEQTWPAYDESFLKTDTIVIAVQVNGKLRGQVTVPSDGKADAIIALAKAEPNVAKFLEGQALKKEIYVPGRLVSFVI